MFEVKMLIWKFCELGTTTNSIIVIYDLSSEAKCKGNCNCSVSQGQHTADV